MSFSVESNFFCRFKTGDNVLYNLAVLSRLYELFENPKIRDRFLLLKPITITLISIIEAILHDFHVRVRANTNEGVANLPSSVINYIRNKDFDELSKYIESSKRHDLFKLAQTNFYEKLEELRRIRNRIHIQNTKGYDPEDEYNLFTEKNKKLAEGCLEIVAKTMSSKYKRPPKMHGYVDKLNFPWDEQFGLFNR